MDTMIVDRVSMLRLTVECLLEEALECRQKAANARHDEVVEHYSHQQFEWLTKAAQIKASLGSK
jgi:hypothetical protein